MPDNIFEVERYELQEPPAYIFRVDRRQFLGTVGAGLLIVAAQRDARGQRASTPGPLEARLHVGDDGVITIFNGKVEEGQGPRTELAMVAAEELAVPLDRIRMVMADTDAVPNDGITAGSRTTPSTVPQVRRAAAAARQLLLTTAAQQWRVPPGRVHMSEGAAVDSGTDRKMTYGDLARSPELAKAYNQTLPADVGLIPVDNWQVLGKPQHRMDGRDIVTGAHSFPSDIKRPGMLFGCVLRPPSFDATLTSVDLNAVKALPGVSAVHDGQFAGCAAPTSFLARKGVEALAATAEWNQKQHRSSDTLFDDLKAHAQADGAGGRNRPKIDGDVEQALAGAKNRLTATYRTAYIQHAPMEPRAAVAEWQNGKLTVWTGTSNPFAVQQELAKAFSIPVASVRVIVPDMGGGFGGKHTGEAAIEAARLARQAKAPVSLRWTRAEEFTWAYFRPAALIEIEAALDNDHRIAAWDFVNYNSGGSGIDTPYRTAASRIRFMPSDAPLRQGSYRALASTANNFARECFMDELAAGAGIDPLEFRLANLQDDRIVAVLKAAAGKFGWQERVKERKPGRGIGLACGTEKNSVVAACAEVEIDPATGEHRLLEICQAFECGAVLNPAGLKSQIEGAIVMGIGAVLREQILFAGGKVTNPRFSAYRVPRFRDVPKIEVVLVNRTDAEPVGAGETPLIAVAPAMANAAFRLTGRPIRSMPFPKTPERTPARA
jgi:isoquinoline 1-oxidoreductase